MLLQAIPTPSVPSSDRGGRNVVRVYLISDGRLKAAARTSDDTSVRSMVDLLAEGPTASEKAAGATTAIAPGGFVVEQAPSSRSRRDSVVIEVPVQFTQIDGDLQLLATAQLVWTVTEPQPLWLVRMTFNGEPIELPTDEGLTSGPVGRSDYAAVAPKNSPLAAPDDQ
ncbi:GerMN domain-containing protein [Nocardioides bigeumensis]|uniref:GerMN domain-containing protein n=1 Tax=Nocardioides bigeumensis TaxID=433657 RepID=A0ABN2XLP1_9ACTN